MSSIVVSEFGGPEVLQLAETGDKPEPAAGQVRIRVEAAAVHPVDVWIRSGGLPDLETPLVLGWDLAGVVDAVGDGVAGWQPGDRVVGLTRWFDTGAGTYADYVVFDADWVAAAPREAAAAEAAVLPLNAQTAAQALDLLKLQPGHTLAVSGAAGQVGGFAVQLAAARGLRVIGVAGPQDQDLVRHLGADFVPRSDDFAAAVRAAVPEGVDAVVDTVSLGTPAIGAVRDSGAFATVTGTAPDPERGIRVERVSVHSDGQQLAELVKLVDAGKLSLRVAGTYRYADAAEAHRRAERGGVRGRIVLVP